MITDLPTLGTAADPAVLIIYTGGTVGMAVNRTGELVPMQFGRLDRKMPELARLALRLTLLSLPQPIDSSNVMLGGAEGEASCQEKEPASGTMELRSWQNASALLRCAQHDVLCSSLIAHC